MKSGYIEQRLKFLHDDTYLQKRDSLFMALHSTLHIIITWGFIFLILYINNTFINIYLNLFSIFIIGAVQHRFFTIYHEAFHYNLFRNKRLNDNAAMFFASFPSFSTYKNAKLRHLNHHFRTATKEDPERVSHISNINDFNMNCLKFSASKGNDLITPMPYYQFPGLKVGDKWCLCVTRWIQAEKAGKAPKLILEATHEKTLLHWYFFYDAHFFINKKLGRTLQF